MSERKSDREMMMFGFLIVIAMLVVASFGRAHSHRELMDLIHMCAERGQ